MGLATTLVLITAACASLAPSTPKPPPPVPEQAAPPAPVVAPPVSEPGAPAVAPEAPAAPHQAPPRRIRIVAVGDIMLGGSAAPEMVKFGYDYPFADVRAVLRGADVVFANLEGPLTEAGEPERDKRYVFRSPPGKVGPALAAAGFNVVSLANNHTMDYGVEGLRQTLSALAAVGIKHAGAGLNLQQARQPALIRAGDQTVAVLAYSLTFPESFWARAGVAGTAFGHEQHVRADVQAARERADIVMVSFHWGREATTELRDYQPRLGRAAIDAGATIVLGHHPHILQGIERYKHGIIFYSLGNFAFGSYSRIAQRSIIAELDIEDARLFRVRLVPLNVNNVEVAFQPRRIASSEAERVVAELRELSAPLQTQIVLDNGVGAVVLSDTPLLSSKRGRVSPEE